VIETIKKILKLLNSKEKQRLIPLTLATVITAVIEVIGIGSLGPFVAVVVDPSVIFSNSFLSTAYEMGGFQTERGFLIGLGILVFVITLLASAFKVLVLYMVFKFAGDLRHNIGLRLFRKYIFQTYPYFLNHNTSELSKNLLSEVDQVVDSVLKPVLESLAKGVMVVATFSFLIITDPLVALGAFVILGVLYVAIYGMVRPKLISNGAELRESNRIRYKIAGETFAAIKDVKILGKEDAFSSEYSIGARRFAKTRAARQILSVLPSYSLQAVVIGFAIGLVIIMLSTSDSLTEILPLLAIYAFAVQRMMPNLQSVFNSIAQIRFMGKAVDALFSDMMTLSVSTETQEIETAGCEAISTAAHGFETEIRISDLSYSYDGSKGRVVDKLNLRIKKNTTIGFVGATGCGKTTLVDLIMGLLTPDEGSVYADSLKVLPPEDNSGLRSWQGNFGYVPQTIVLSDDTVAANIAFGIPEQYRNQAAIERAATIANLDAFVDAELPKKYDTIVGERGVRLSGGQKQRIGIARAIYHDPQILVMDEATSALDSITEIAVMDAIHNLMHTKTIIIIAHRIATLRECDVIYLMENGTIIASGSYQELIESESRFRSFANERPE
jgi:ABC-type multidrug transport system fused ATPase/permease subunit